LLVGPGGDSDTHPPVTKADVQIVQRARKILNAQSRVDSNVDVVLTSYGDVPVRCVTPDSWRQ
jgi:hypothetical protein